MNRRTPRPGGKVAILTVALAAATAGILGLEWARAAGSDRAAARQFERMAGGLGLGATVCPRWCLVNFDPRLEHCTCPEQPLPGGYCYCPDHGGTVSFFVGRLSRAVRDGSGEPSYAVRDGSGDASHRKRGTPAP